MAIDLIELGRELELLTTGIRALRADVNTHGGDIARLMDKFKPRDATWAATTIQRHYRGRSKQLQRKIQIAINKLPPAKVQRARSGGLDEIGELITDVLGSSVWKRAIYNAPDAWDELEMTKAMADALGYPARSPHMWLLAQPTKYERVMLQMYAQR